MFNCCKQLFPNEGNSLTIDTHVLIEIYEEFIHQDLSFQSGRSFQFDTFVPKLKLALEYQGEQHYYQVYPLGQLDQIQRRDQEKRTACKAHEINLIEVPYWWDRTKESLAATISQIMPHLNIPLPPNIKPIPHYPPEGLPQGNLTSIDHEIFRSWNCILSHACEELGRDQRFHGMVDHREVGWNSSLLGRREYVFKKREKT